MEEQHTPQLSQRWIHYKHAANNHWQSRLAGSLKTEIIKAAIIIEQLRDRWLVSGNNSTQITLLSSQPRLCIKLAYYIPTPRIAQFVVDEETIGLVCKRIPFLQQPCQRNVIFLFNANESNGIPF
jgi:hypothetical protein